MLAVKHVVTYIKTAVQRRCGLRIDIDNSALLVNDQGSYTNEDDQFRYCFARALPAGWYMLHVNGVKETLGHDFQLRDEAGETVHLQVGAKATTKRIMRLRHKTSAIGLAIFPGPVSADQFHVSLVRISSRFAISRMFRKLSSSNGIVGRRYAALVPKQLKNTADRLYADYSGLMQRHVKRVDYQEWLQAMSPDLAENKVDKDEVTFESIRTATTNEALSSPQQNNVTPMSNKLNKPSITFLLVGASSSEAVLIKESLTSGRQAFTQINVLTDTEFDAQKTSLNTSASNYIVAVGKGVILNPALVPELLRILPRLPDARLFYSDHDVLSAEGQRSCPAFKPGWNKELLMAGNYVGNFLVLRPELIEAVGGFDLSMDTSIFYDFLLRASTHLKRGEVERIPRMLFSRSDQDQQDRTGMTWGSKDREALEAHLKQNSLPGLVQPGLLDRVMQVQWQVPETPPFVDIIIPTRDRVDLLQCCIESIFENTEYQHYCIMVVDNGSTEAATKDYYRSLESNPRFNVVEYPGEFNYSAINNFAVAQTSGDVVVLLNNDTEICESDWLTHMVAQAARPNVGCVGAKLYYSSGLIQHAGVVVGIRGVAGHAHRFYPRDADGHCGRLKIAQNVSAVTAACLAVRREVFEEVGGLDEVNLKVAYNDVDFCLRVLEAGYDNVWTPHVELFHHESVSRGSDDTLKKARRFQQEFDYMVSRWHTDTMKDPSYNPNLALDQEDFWLAA